MRKANVLPIAVMAFALVAFLFVLEYSINDYRLPWSANMPAENTNVGACTQEAKLCPDGSYVGRTGSSCEFAPCPTPTSNTNSQTNSNTSNSNTNSSVNTNTQSKVSLVVTFVNNQNQSPITNTGVELYSDNGIRCVTEPCPTNGRTMIGTTDSVGSITVPVAYVDESMIFTLNGYQGKELHVSGTLQANRSWKLLLTPKT